MRNPFAVFALTLVQPQLRTTACGHCGDSFTGDPADGRAWLTAHGASEHGRAVQGGEPHAVRTLPARRPVPAAALSASTSRS